MSLLEARQQHDTVQSFLSDRDVHVTARPAPLTHRELNELIMFTQDIDGIVLELEELDTISLHLPYIRLIGQRNTAKVYHRLKKHLVLSDYSAREIEALKGITALTVADQGGWLVQVGFVPLPGCPSPQSPPPLAQVHKNFTTKLEQLPPHDLARISIRKNSLSRVDNFNLMPIDQPFILGLLDKAIHDVPMADGWRVIKFMSLFGQKQESALLLSSVVCRTESIRCLSVHAACTLHLNGGDHLFWSRDSIQELIGHRGSLFASLTLSAAVNFQSNMDHRPLDLGKRLLALATRPSDVTFLQLYADTPHRHLKDFVCHPVTGSIVTTGLLHYQTDKRLHDRAEAYLTHFGDEARKFLGTQVCARLELVCRTSVQDLPEHDRVDPASFLSRRALVELLLDDEHPVLLPFNEFPLMEARTPRMLTFSSVISEVALWMVDELRQIHQQYAAKGGFNPSWRAFQIELALEKFLWGKTISRRDNPWATGLGPGRQDPDDSFTWYRGFLGLEPPNSCAADEHDPPPLFHWTPNQVQKRRIKMLFDFADILHTSSSPLIGARLLHFFVHDLNPNYQISHLSIERLKSKDPPPGMIIMGTATPEQVVKSVTENITLLRFPAVSQRAWALMSQQGHAPDPNHIITEGLAEVGLRYFPLVRRYDESRNPKASWDGKKVMEVILPGGTASAAAKAAFITDEVLLFLETNEFTWPRHLDPYREYGLPWMVAVMRRLAPLKLSDDQHFKVCTFLSAVGMLQNKGYIMYTKLVQLCQELKVQQHVLQKMKVLSNVLLQPVHGCKVFRLHEDIPCTPPKDRPRQPLGHTDTLKEQDVDPLLPVDVGMEPQEQDLMKAKVIHRPPNYHRVWDDNERDILLQVKLQGPWENLASAYKLYVKLSLERKIPDRTFKAFRCRYTKYCKE